MPELPEVETIRRGLADCIVGETISQVEIRLPKMVTSVAPDFVRELEGNSFHSIERQGKLLIFNLARSADLSMLLHLKMTGQLIYRHGDEQIAGGHPWPSYNEDLPNKYSHVIFTFDSGARLFFNDQRQFGYVKLVDQTAVKKEKSRYGIEPLTPAFTREAFFAVLANQRTALKAVLLNQQLISGIGNIYADEICFYAGVRPNRKVDSLTNLEKSLLFDACQVIIGTAIHHRGTTISDYADSSGRRGNYSDFLKVYGQAGQTCLRCGGTIIKTKLAGRGTHWCESCQA